MRVVHVSEVHSGGVRRLLDDYTSDQLQRGLEIHVVGGPELADLPGTHHLWRGNRRRVPQAGPDAVTLQRLLADLEPDIVHLHSFFAGAYGRSLHRSNTYPILYQPHGWAFRATDSRAMRAGLVGFERWASHRTDLLATNSRDEITEARLLGIETPAAALGVPIDIDHFVPLNEGDRKAMRSTLQVDDKVVLLCLGRLARQKGYDILLREWERRPIDGAAIYLLGPGPSDWLERFAPTQWGRTVHAVGEVDDPRPWLQAADLMLLPSRYEGQSLAVSEALASGLPVVAFDVNGAESAICAGGSAAGAVVPLGDANALLTEARRRIEDPFLRETESAAARLRAETDSDRSMLLGRVVEMYEAVVEAYPGPVDDSKLVAPPRAW